MLNKFQSSLLLIFLIGMPCCLASTFEFYGDGIAQERDHSQKDQFTPFSLSCDFGEIQTAFVTYHHLRPGYYSVKALVRADKVQKGSEGYSFWHFYDGGFGVKTIYADLFGSYGPREVTYQVQVKNSDLTVWFRLKSPGKVFVDSFVLTPVLYQNQKTNISNSTPFIREKDPVHLQQSLGEDFLRLPLFHFNTLEKGHPFELKKDNRNGGVAVLSAHQYYNFAPEKFNISDWSDFDRIEFDLFNPNDHYVNFNFTMADDLSKDYWSQLNHNETLAPGWNHLTLSLRQYVGERGSVRFLRSLDLKKIKKLFMGIEPESKNLLAQKVFYIDNIDLIKDKMPLPPKDVLAFDFTSHKAPANSFLRVTTQDIFSLDKKYGFEDPKFWRVEDSLGPSSFYRYSIGILAGKFKVIVPNGKYHFQWVIDKLGLWDVPFFKDRTLFVNGLPFYKETRNSAQDFLSDFLRFETIIPTIMDRPFNLYHAKILKPIEGSVDVKNGQINFEFSGDASALSLNTLILWNQKNSVKAKSFLQKFNDRNEREFTWQSRSLDKNQGVKSHDKLDVRAIAMTKKLSLDSYGKALATKLDFMAGKKDKESKLLQILPFKTDSIINFKAGMIKDDKGNTIKNISLKMSEVINQFVSPGIGHETYFLNGTYLRELTKNSFPMRASELKYLWIDVQTSSETAPGTYSSMIEFSYQGQKVSFPIELKVLSYELPKVNFPVGFLGLDPLPYSYFNGNGWNEIRKKYRFKALQLLAEAGFTSFSGLPDVPLKIVKNNVELETRELEETLNEAKRLGFEGPFFSYGGQFPDKLLRPQSFPLNMQEDEYYLKLSSALKSFLSLPQIPKMVYLFSDEAAGYSQKTQDDYQFGLKIKKHFPFLLMGGFSSFDKQDQTLEKLNTLFDFGFFSSLTQQNRDYLLKHKIKWGFYNAVPGNLDDPRFAFGAGLYLARQHGLSHYLEWNSMGFNQYPYFDFDGRESDVVLFYPSLKNGLYPSIRFEMARIGLKTFKKLMLLESMLSDPKVPAPLKQELKEFLNKLETSNSFFASGSFLSLKNFQHESFSKDLDKLLLKIFINR